MNKKWLTKFLAPVLALSLVLALSPIGVSAVDPPAPEVVPTGDGVTPAHLTMLDGFQTFTFPFETTNDSLTELELDIYLGDNTGAGRDYGDAVSINLPADEEGEEGIKGLIGQIDSAFNTYDRATLVSSVFDGENEVRLYEAAGFRVGQERAAYVENNIKYTEGADSSEGTWTLRLNTYRLREDTLELLVAVHDDQGEQWGHNNFSLYPERTQAFCYPLTAADMSGGISITATKTDGETVAADTSEIANMFMDWTIGDTVEYITAVFSGPVEVLNDTGSFAVTMSSTDTTTLDGTSQTIPADTPYGTAVLGNPDDPDDPDDDYYSNTIVITPSGGNGTAGLLGTVTFTVAADTLATVDGGTQNPSITFTLNVLKPETVYVDPDYAGTAIGDPIDGHTFGLDAFATIEDGMDGVREGGTVNVAKAEVHYESTVISKSLTLNGVPDAEDNLPVIDGGGTDVVVTINQDDVTFSGFSIQNSGVDYQVGGDGKMIHQYAGIGLQGVSGCTIQYNMINNCSSGIALLASTDNTIKDNNIGDIGAYGIVLTCLTDPDTDPSTGNTVSGNLIEVCGLDGIYADEKCDSNTFENNEITGTGTNDEEDILKGDSDDLDGNGIYLWKSGGNTITDNTISGNIDSGIEMQASCENIITGNEITDNTCNGILVRRYEEDDSTLNKINNNKIYGNGTWELKAEDTDEIVEHVNAECNWWGTADETEIKDGISCHIEDGVRAVDYIPYYIDEAMTTLSSGDAIYVDRLYTEESCGGHTWGVNAFTTIAEGIDAAGIGKTVYVVSDTYTENIEIDKPLTLIGLSNDEEVKPTIDGDGNNGTGIVVLITADNVTVDGFTVQNAGTDLLYDGNPMNPGIALQNASNCTISNNNITVGQAEPTVIGIALTTTDGNDETGNKIENNTITGMVGHGVAIIGDYTDADRSEPLSTVTATTIAGNTIQVYGGTGIACDRDCTSNIIKDNTIIGSGTENSSIGIEFWKCGANLATLETVTGNTVTGNTIMDNDIGINHTSSSGNTFTGNNITGNNVGFNLRGSGYGDIVRAVYPPSPNYLNKNNIYDNTSYAIATEDTMSKDTYGDTLDATYNYWGEGVTSAADISGYIDEYNGDGVVDYDPWCGNMIYGITFYSDASDVDNPDDMWVESGEAIGELPMLTRAGYIFGGWYTGQNGTGTRYLTTSAMSESALALYAYWYAPAAPGGPAPGSVAATTDGDDTITGTLTTTDDGLTVTMTRDSFDEVAGNTDTGVVVETDLGKVTFDAEAMDFISGSSDTGDVTLTIENVDVSALSEDVQAAIGTRPVYDFTLMAGDAQVTDFGGGTASVSIPYTLQAGEDPNAVVVYYIDDSGNLVTVLGAYNAETGAVDFTVTHFSAYGVGYHKVTFSDVAETIWYYDPVTFIAARGITEGVGGNAFDPDGALTRGQFIVMLMRAYGIDPDETPSNNFADAGDTYYTGYLSAAKRLGIAEGVGDNLFVPDDAITRQDMFTLLYRALGVLDMLPETDAPVAELTDFPDAANVADYALEALSVFVENGIVSGSDGKLLPGGGTTRAQMAQTFYNLLSA